jgi:hypothetical protein
MASLRGGVIVRMYEHRAANLPPKPNIRRVADYLGTNPKTISRWFATGPRRLRINRDELLNLGRPVGGAA